MRIPSDSDKRLIIVVDTSRGNKELLKYYSMYVPTAYSEQITIDDKHYTIRIVQHVIKPEYMDITTIVYVEPGYYGVTHSEKS